MNVRRGKDWPSQIDLGSLGFSAVVGHQFLNVFMDII